MPAASPRTRRSAPRKAPAATKRAAAVPQVAREKHIAQIAYSLAEARGFAPGGELDDWLAAEVQYETARAGKRQALGRGA